MLYIDCKDSKKTGASELTPALWPANAN